jgi:hypothetical protein
MISPRVRLSLLLLGLLLALASCAQPMPTVIPTPQSLTPTPLIEDRTLELEWPAHLRLGESDVLRLALIPVDGGYVARTEFNEHPLETQEAPIRQLPGYTLFGIARLDGVGFEIAPQGDQRHIIPPGQEVAWRWTLAAREPGQQRLSIGLTLRWEPQPGVTGPVSESLAFGRGLTVQVDSILGMTRAQATSGAILVLFGGLVLAGFALVRLRRPKSPGLRTTAPNRNLVIEPGPAIRLSGEETSLLQALFPAYQRLLLESEFISGYSGARTFLVRPLLADGRSDAETIAKLGARRMIQAEFENYERFVKKRLPPVTARIQHAPVALRGGKLAAMQYTFISEPGHPPRSLRQALLENPDPAYLYHLFETFGPNWWMQRQAYTFRVEQEYDRLLPPHWLVEPAPSERAQGILGPEMELQPRQGEILKLGIFESRELRADRQSWSLVFAAQDGRPALRVRWLATQPPSAGEPVKIVASRRLLLQSWTASLQRFGLPDPLESLQPWLERTLQATRSTIHGDLNLENILVGPGDLIWLIDFAQTREGHPLLDFSHLEAEIVAHILAPGCGSAEAFLDRLVSGDALLAAVQEIASRCLFDPLRKEEYALSLALACLGALKYANLPELAKHCLYLTAAYQAQRLQSE